MELYALRYGTSSFPRGRLFSDYQGDEAMPISWCLYLIRQAELTILVDTGFSDRAHASAWGVTMHQDPLLMLAGLGISPTMVDDVIITHHHFDHILNLPEFTRARVHISDEARAAYVQGVPAQGHDAIREILADPVRTRAFTQESQVASGALTIENIGGHSPGSSVVRLHGANSRYLITGDECYLCANLEEGSPIGVTCDHAKNASFIARSRAARAIPLPFHDPVIFERYPCPHPDVARIL